MGKCDIILSQYFEDDCRYADLINGLVFEGRQVVDEKAILDRNPVITGFLGKVKGCIPIQKYRDAVRKIVFGMNFIVLGLEHPFLGGITKEDRFKAVVTIVLYLSLIHISEPTRH